MFEHEGPKILGSRWRYRGDKIYVVYTIPAAGSRDRQIIIPAVC